MWGKLRKGWRAAREQRRADGAARTGAARRPDHLPPKSLPGTGITPITSPPSGGPEPAVYGLPPWADEVDDR